MVKACVPPLANLICNVPIGIVGNPFELHLGPQLCEQPRLPPVLIALLRFVDFLLNKRSLARIDGMDEHFCNCGLLPRR